MFDGEQGAGAGQGSESAAAVGTETQKQETKETQKTEAPAEEQLGDAGKAALQREREAREASDKEVKRLKKIVDDAEAAARKREADEAKAKGDFEALAKTAQEERDALKAELAERDKRDLRARVAKANKLPEEIAPTLQGDDEAAMNEHAKLLAKYVKPQAAPDTEAGAGAGVTTKTGDRPIVKARDEKAPSYTYDGRPKVAWPSRT